MKLPKSFDELTVGQYQELNFIIQENEDLLERHIKMIACLSDLPYDTVENNTPKQIQDWCKEIQFIYNPEACSKQIVKRLFLNNRWIGPVIGAEQLLASQVLTLKHLEEQNKPVELLNQMLACLYVELDKLGNPKPYNASIHNQLAENLKSAKMGDVNGTLFFYADVYERLKPIIQIYLSKATETIQATMPEVIAWARQNPQILKEAGLTLL